MNKLFRSKKLLLALAIIGCLVYAHLSLPHTSQTLSLSSSLSPTTAKTLSHQVKGERTILSPTVMPTHAPQGTAATVTRVIDGDTFVINTGQKVRYIGIDTPETVDPRRPVMCFGKQASDENKRLILGKTITMIKDVSEIDKYGRLLRYVYLPDGTFVNQLLVKEGFARATSYPPDVKYQDIFRQAEQEARDQGLGLWTACGLTPTPVLQSDHSAGQAATPLAQTTPAQN